MTGPLPELVAQAIGRMPDPSGARQAEALEAELVAWARVPYAVTVSSGTAALHTALVAAGIGPGDEVLVPAVCVVMSAAPVLYAGARPVFVDCVSGGFELDYDDLAAKLTARTRAVLPVHLWGRACCDMPRLRGFAAERRMVVIEDACQAHGTRAGNGEMLGTLGDAGCFSLKDGKILWSGEGGFVLTSDESIAARARAFRTHWQTPPAGQAPLASLGHNYRLAEPLAAIARANLSQVNKRVADRKAQTALLTALLDGTPGVQPAGPAPGEDWNGYSPIFRLAPGLGRRFCEYLAGEGVPNSVGTYRLTAANLRSVFGSGEECPSAEALIDSTLAITLSEQDNDERIHFYARMIDQEARRWMA